MERFIIRPMREADIPMLVDLRPGFISESVLRVQRTGTGLEGGWQLVEVPLPKPYDKGKGYDFDEVEQRNIRYRLSLPYSLEEVVIDRNSQNIVGVLDVTIERWRNAAWIWNLMLDLDVRGIGLGRRLIEHTIEWARYRKLRAVMLETQTNNVPACKFYSKMGFNLVGVNDAFYTNQDYERDEIALFWSYPLET